MRVERPPSSSGLGRRPLTALTPVQIRLGVQIPAGLRPCFFVSCAAALGICKNKSMRIVLVSDTFRPTMGGIETQVGALADHLHARGHDIVVLTCTPEGDSSSTCPIRCCVPRGAILSTRRSIPKPPVALLTSFVVLIPDVVHYHMGELTPVVQSVLAQPSRISRIPAGRYRSILCGTPA